MEIKSRITDTRINAENIFIELSYKEYIEIARLITLNNPLQRKRVKSSNTVYSLLRNDLKKGCLVPPIVLALSNDNHQELSEISDEEILNYLSEHKENLIILDGLQRTYTFLDVELELMNSKDEEQLQKFYNHKLRMELYLGINKFGILYRMLTLNTGQTPMSIRHQLEILYKDYLDQNINGINLVSEVDNDSINEIRMYKFNDIIDGFNSYLERNELPIDRFELLNNIKGLEKLSVENHKKDLFKDFLIAYDTFIIKVQELSDGWEFNQSSQEELEVSSRKLDGQPFGRVVFKIFNKSQPITGFGAALGKLKDFNKINDFEEWESKIQNITFNGEFEDWILDLIWHLDKIKVNSKKIGNSQRLYFYWFFRELFNEDSDSYLNLSEAVTNGYQRYRSQME
ncbi:hypothetical protein [Exiguobacterium sp. s146]|uniref:hypothetical protein n=1 Tax=Exiguobacterium sp. s146 TaxID=2751223 RepID=UPI001BE67743|nr:hypothetical protein [Exiguobacterium sp. s146]